MPSAHGWCCAVVVIASNSHHCSMSSRFRARRARRALLWRARSAPMRAGRNLASFCRTPRVRGCAWTSSSRCWTLRTLRTIESARYGRHRHAREWSHSGVTKSASPFVSVDYRREYMLGKTLQLRFLKLMVFPEAHQSARRFPSFRQKSANGVTAESCLRRQGLTCYPRKWLAEPNSRTLPPQ